MTYIISQVFVCLTYIMSGATYLTTKRTNILIFSLAALFCNGMHYSLLGAWAGLGVVIIAVFRNFLFLIQQKIKVLDNYIIDDWIILITLMVVSVITGIFTYDSIFSLFMIVASIIFTISVWQKNIKVYKILGLISSVLSLVYYIYIASIFAIILEVVLFIFMLVTSIIYFKKERNKTVKTEEIVEEV